MIWRVFLGLSVLVIAALIWQIISLHGTYNQLDEVPASHSLTPGEYDLIVVEFLSYSCPYCRQIHIPFKQALQRDGKIRYIPRALPSPDEAGRNAALFALAAAEQGRFIEAHEAMLTGDLNADSDALRTTAETLGLDPEQLNTAMNAPETSDYLTRNLDLFQKIGGTATPSFILNGVIFYVPEGRMPTADDFTRMFAEARSYTASDLPAPANLNETP